MRKNSRAFILYLSILGFIMLFLMMSGGLNDNNTTIEYTYDDLIHDLTNDDPNDIYQITISNNNQLFDTGSVYVYKDPLNTNNYFTVQIPSMDSFMDLLTSVAMENDFINIKTQKVANTSSFFDIMTTFLLIGAILSVLILITQKGSGNNKAFTFGKSKAKMILDESGENTFDKVAGLEEEKLELQEVVEFLKEPKKFSDMGARIPKGILLTGPPGTGKTLLAKAVAGEAHVPFFTISGSDFVEMFVGVGASRVRDLFAEAKKQAPCIVFIDEIDAVGRKRGAGMGGGHDEKEQTLNQLLVEMDGFGDNQGIIILAATNRPDVLDKALLRPGRFDRQVIIGVPDVKGRTEILKIHAKNKKFASDVEFDVIAKTTSGFTGADLENLLNESAIISARDDKDEIDMDSVRKAFVKIGVGTEKKSRVIPEAERKITAYHEAGHAIMFEVMKNLDPVHIVSIIPTGFAGGFTMPLPIEEKSYMTKNRMIEEIMGLLGGRVAEKLVLGDITTGASNDIQRATSIARGMVTKYGMSDKLGTIQFGETNNESLFLGGGTSSRNYGENVATIIDEEIKAIIDECFNNTVDIINEHMDVLHKAAELLLEKDKISGDEFRELFDEGVLPDKNIPSLNE